MGRGRIPRTGSSFRSHVPRGGPQGTRHESLRRARHSRMTSPPVRVVGSFFRPIGISRVARISLASFRAAGIDAKAFDLWGEPPSSQVDSWPAAHRSSDLGTFNL